MSDPIRLTGRAIPGRWSLPRYYALVHPVFGDAFACTLPTHSPSEALAAGRVLRRTLRPDVQCRTDLVGLYPEVTS